MMLHYYYHISPERDYECINPFAEKRKIREIVGLWNKHTFFKPINPFSWRKISRYSESRNNARKQLNTGNETSFFELKHTRISQFELNQSI